MFGETVYRSVPFCMIKIKAYRTTVISGSGVSEPFLIGTWALLPLPVISKFGLPFQIHYTVHSLSAKRMFQSLIFQCLRAFF